MEQFSQYSDPVLESHGHQAFNTTVNYTLVFLVRGNVGSIVFSAFSSWVEKQTSVEIEYVWMHGDRSANKTGA